MKARFALPVLMLLGALSFNALAEGAGTAARALFTTAVVDREPTDKVDTVPAGTETVYFYTDLRNLSGETVTHRWLYKGEVMAEVPFTVRGPRWRVWSSKKMQPDWSGQWTVEVVDSAGNQLATDALIVGDAEPAMNQESSDTEVDKPATTDGSAPSSQATSGKESAAAKPAAADAGVDDTAASQEPKAAEDAADSASEAAPAKAAD